MKTVYREEHQGAEDLEDSIANLDLPPVDTLKEKGDTTLTSASLVSLLPAEHLVAKQAFKPQTIDKGATAIRGLWTQL